MFPNAPIYPNTFFPDNIRNYYGFRIGMGMILSHMFFSSGERLFLALAVALSYLKGIAPIITRELRANCTNYRTTKDLRTVQNLLIAYRSLEVYHKVSMEFLSVSLIPIETAVVQLILTCNFILIRHGAKLSSIPLTLALFWSVLFLGFWTVFLNVCGLFLKHSEGTIRSWKRLTFKDPMDAKIFARFRKSCRPMKVGQGDYYTIKRLTVLTFLRGIIRGTFRVMLTLPSNF